MVFKCFVICGRTYSGIQFPFLVTSLALGAGVGIREGLRKLFNDKNSQSVLLACQLELMGKTYLGSKSLGI